MESAGPRVRAVQSPESGNRASWVEEVTVITTRNPKLPHPQAHTRLPPNTPTQTPPPPYWAKSSTFPTLTHAPLYHPLHMWGGGVKMCLFFSLHSPSQWRSEFCIVYFKKWCQFLYTFFPVHTGRDPSNICNNEQVKNLIYFKLFEKMNAIKHTHSSQLHFILRWRYLKNYVMLWVFVHRTNNLYGV